MADTEDRTPSDVDDLRWTISQGIDADPYSSKRDNEAAHAALRTLCEHVSRLTAEIDRANRALNEIIALDEKGPAWEPYDEFGDPSDIDVSNSGDQRRHGAWTAYQWAARIARAARTHPEGSNAPTSR